MQLKKTKQLATDIQVDRVNRRHNFWLNNVKNNLCK